MTRSRLSACLVLLTAAALSGAGLAMPAPASATAVTSSVIAIRSGSTVQGGNGTGSLVYQDAGVVVGNAQTGAAAINGQASASNNYQGWSLTFPRLVKPGSYTFAGNGGTPYWFSTTTCDGTVSAVVHDSAWTSAGVPTRLSISLTYPCGGSVNSKTYVEIRYAEPTTIGVGEAIAPQGQSTPTTTVGTPVAMTRSFTNAGTAPAVMGAAIVTADSNPKYQSFFITDDQCKGTTLAPGGTCTVGLTFNPPVSSAPSALLYVPDGRPLPSTAGLSGTANPMPDQPHGVSVYGLLGSEVVSWSTPFVTTTSHHYDGFDILAVNADGSLGSVVATSGPSTYAEYRSVEITGLPDRTRETFAVRAIMPGGAPGPVSYPDGDTTVGRLLIAAGRDGISMGGLDPLGNRFTRTSLSGNRYHRLVASPDGSTIALGFGWNGYGCSVLLTPRDGLTDPTYLPRTANECDDYPSFTSDTTLVLSHIADESVDSTPSLETYDLTTDVAAPIVGGAGLTMPAAAPDGTIVAVDPSTQSLVRVTPGVATPVAIPNTSSASTPAVDPATGEIAFVQTGEGGVRHIAMVAADGTGLTTLNAGVNNESPSWDGKRLYFDDNGVLWHASLPSGAVTQDTPNNNGEYLTPFVLEAPDAVAPTVTTSALPAFSTTNAGVTVAAIDPGPGGSGVDHLDGELSSSASGPWTAPSGWTGTQTSTFTIPVVNGQRSCFHARATDVSGNTSDWTTPVCVTGDTTAPALHSLSTPAIYSPNGQLAVTPSFTDSGSGLGQVLYRYRRAAPGGAMSGLTAGTLTTPSYTVSMPAGYEYCASFAAKDKLGNTSAWSVERCAIAALDDRALALGGSGARLSSSAFHAATITQLTAAGSQLTLSSVSGRQLGLLARTCSGCGYLDVYVASTRLARISLVTSTTRNQVMIWLPRQSAIRTGKLTIRQVDKRTTFIDALVVQHL